MRDMHGTISVVRMVLDLLSLKMGKYFQNKHWHLKSKSRKQKREKRRGGWGNKKEKTNHTGVRAKKMKFLCSKIGMCLYLGKLGKMSSDTAISALQRNKYYPSKCNGTCPSCRAGDSELCCLCIDEFNFPQA